MSDRISTHDFYENTSRHMSKLYDVQAHMAMQTGSDRIYQSFSDLGQMKNIRHVVDFNAKHHRFSAYNASAQQFKLRSEKIISTIDRIYEIAQDTIHTILSSSSTGTMPEQEMLTHHAVHQLNALEGALNASVGDVYILSGGKMNAQPVQNIMEEKNFNMDEQGQYMFTPSEINNTYYKGDSMSTGFQVSENTCLHTEFNAGDENIAHIIGTLQMIRHGTWDRDNINDIRVSLEQAASNLLKIQQKTKSDYVMADQYASHCADMKMEINKMQDHMNSENSLDIINLIGQYKQNEPILSAAQYMFANASKMSILKYLT